MHIYLKAAGMFTQYLGSTPLQIELADQATLRDLLEQFDRCLANRLPEFLWNREERRFRGPVVISIDKKISTDLSIRLEEGQEISLFKAVVGG